MSEGPSLVDVVCGMREQMLQALSVIVLMGFLAAFSVVFVSPGDDAFPILVIDGVLIAVSLLFFGGSYWYCTKRAMDEE